MSKHKYKYILLCIVAYCFERLLLLFNLGRLSCCSVLSDYLHHTGYCFACFLSSNYTLYLYIDSKNT